MTSAESISKTTLSLCREGDDVAVTRISGGGAFRKRLLEMGVVRGAQLKIVRYAPLKDPMELVVKGYHLTLRVEEAGKVEVERLTPKKAA